MIIRVTEENFQRAVSVYTESWRSSHRAVCTERAIHSHDETYQSEFLTARLRDGWELFLHDTNGSADGLVGFCRKTGEIGLLYVLPAAQEHGIGTCLLTYCLFRLIPDSVPFLTVLSTNEGAIRLYERFGFTFSGGKKLLSEEKQIYELTYLHRGGAMLARETLPE